MYSYIVCSLFFLVFTILLIFVGRQFFGCREFSESLILGYIVYSFPVAVVGITVQLLNLPWIIFAAFLGIEWIILAAGSVLIMKKKGRKIIGGQELREFAKDNWVVFLVTFLMVAVMLLYYRGFWLCNHQDDGYYITKVATLPFTQTGGNYNYALGVDNPGFSSYLLNTWEIEASVYVHFLKVNVTLFLRLFQSAFHYFLFANLLKAFSQKILMNSAFARYKNLAQYPVLVILLFNVYYLALEHMNLLHLQDMFHMNSGMFLGFSIVRTMGILLLLLFFIDKDKINVKMVAGAVVLAVLLISKSSVALPVIVIAGLSFLIVCLFTSYQRGGRILAGLLCAGSVAAGFVLAGSEYVQSAVYANFKNILYSPVIWGCMIVFLLSFTLRSAIVNKLNGIICCMMGLVLIPEINDLFESFSVYNFVGGRTVSALVFFFIMVNSVYFCMLLNKIHVKEGAIKVVYLAACAGIFAICLIGFKLYGGEVLPGRPATGASIRQSLGTIKDNAYFMPNSTIELGEKLDRLSEESEETIQVVTPTMVSLDGALHPLPVMLRIYAPDIVPVSAALRFPANDGSSLSEYTQQYYDLFISDPSDETYEVFKNEIQDLNVNCIVVYNKECAPWLESDGYEIYDTVGEELYYIWYKE